MSWLSALLLALAPAQEGGVEGTRPALRVLYVGDESSNDRVRAGRGAAFERFLELHFDHVETRTHEDVDADALAWAQVVLLDWHQSGSLDLPESPLGPREDWRTPTVLMGSAGLNLARAWRVRGASG